MSEDPRGADASCGCGLRSFYSFWYADTVLKAIYSQLLFATLSQLLQRWTSPHLKLFQGSLHRRAERRIARLKIRHVGFFEIPKRIQRLCILHCRLIPVISHAPPVVQLLIPQQHDCRAAYAIPNSKIPHNVRASPFLIIPNTQLRKVFRFK